MFKYDVVKNGRVVGWASVTQEGLYNCIYCSCRFSTKGLTRIYMGQDGNQVDLGICVPDGQEMVIKKKIAHKNIQNIERIFRVVSAGDSGSSFHIPVCESMPLPDISGLQNAKLTYAGNILYFEITDQSPDQQDSDRIP